MTQKTKKYFFEKTLNPIKNFFVILRSAIFSMPNHNAFEMSGYLSFLTFIAILPCTIFLTKLIFFLNYFIFKPDLQVDLTETLIDAFNKIEELPIKNLQKEVTKILKSPPKSIVSYAIFGLIWTSSSTIDAIRVVLNRAYNLKSKKHYIFNRLFSVLQFIIISIITILIIFFLHVILPWILKYGIGIDQIYLNQKYSSEINKIFYFFKYIINALLLLSYALWLNFILPDKNQKKYSLKNLLPGSLITIIMWIISSQVLQFYFTKFFQFNIIYGSLANIISILLFFYVSFLCLILGAEFNYFYNKKNSLIDGGKNL